MDYHLSENKFNALPDDLKKEVLDFIDFLVKKHMPSKTDHQFDFNWEGGLAEEFSLTVQLTEIHRVACRHIRRSYSTSWMSSRNSIHISYELA